MSPIASRPVRAAFARVALCFAALATLGFPGCPDDATKPGGGTSSSSQMSDCWPNDDGREWVYAVTQRQLEDPGIPYVPDGQPVPEITLQEARALLRNPVTADSLATHEFGFQMRFEGTRATQSGVVGQNLVETVAIPAPGGAARAGASFGDAFLERLAQARPDLRRRLAAAGVKVASPTKLIRDARYPLYYPYFIHGYVWIKGPSYIGTYGDVDTMLAWKFLESNVRAGHTFKHQLVPSLASDVWLHASIEGRIRVILPGGKVVNNALEVLYLIDYGVSDATDESGNILGQLRSFDYGRVVYAPGVGPVSDLERRMAFAGETLTLGLVELRLDLTSTGVVTGAPRLAAAGGR